MPAGGGFQLVVDVVDVLHAFALKPFAERRRSLLRIDRDTIFPGRPAAEHAIELHTGFSREFERLAELRVADASREINERLGRDARSLVEVIDGFFLGI